MNRERYSGIESQRELEGNKPSHIRCKRKSKIEGKRALNDSTE